MDQSAPRFSVPVQGGRSATVRGLRAAPRGGPSDAARGDERFRALFEDAAAGVALCLPDGTFADVNRPLRALLAGTGVDPDADGLADLGRDAPAGGAAGRWRADLEDVRAGRAPVARADLALAPAGAPPCRVRVTAALVVLGERRYLVAHVRELTSPGDPARAATRVDAEAPLLTLLPDLVDGAADVEVADRTG